MLFSRNPRGGKRRYHHRRLNLEGLELRTLLSGSSAVSPPPATHLELIAPPTVFSGQPAPLTVVALDAANHPALGYTGTVEFTSSEQGDGLPANYTFQAGDQGAHNFQVKLNTLGNDTVMATDAATAAITGSVQTDVTPAPLVTHLQLVVPEVSFAGQPAHITVMALDAANNPVPNFTGSVQFGGGKAGDTLPGEYTFAAADKGVHQFTATLASLGNDTLSVSEVANSSVKSSATTDVVPAPVPTHFAVVATGPAVAGQPTTISVVALNADNDPVPGYLGEVQFASTGMNDSLPSEYAFTKSDQGAHQFKVTFGAAGSDTLTVTDAAHASLSGSEALNVLSTPPPSGSQPPVTSPTHLEVIIPPTAFVGQPVNVQVVALDAANHPAAGYTGTIAFSSSDSKAGLPAQYTFTSNDHGAHIFSANLSTLGSDTLTVADTSNASLTDTVPVIVTPAPSMTHFAVILPEVAFAGVPTPVTVVALDAANNPVPNFQGTPVFSSSNNSDSLPAIYHYKASEHGAHVYQVTFAGMGPDTVSVHGLVMTGNTGQGTTLVVPAPIVTHFQVVATGPAVAGQPTSISVVALNASNDPMPGYTGTVQFASTGNGDTLPANYTFVAGDHGAHLLQVTFAGSGSDTLTVSDAAHSSVTGSETLMVSTNQPAGGSQGGAGGTGGQQGGGQQGGGGNGGPPPQGGQQGGSGGQGGQGGPAGQGGQGGQSGNCGGQGGGSSGGPGGAAGGQGGQPGGQSGYLGGQPNGTSGGQNGGGQSGVQAGSSHTLATDAVFAAYR